VLIREVHFTVPIMSPSGARTTRLSIDGAQANCDSLELRIDLFAILARGPRGLKLVPLTQVADCEPVDAEAPELAAEVPTRRGRRKAAQEG
jgi:hypothetical protein